MRTSRTAGLSAAGGRPTCRGRGPTPLHRLQSWPSTRAGPCVYSSLEGHGKRRLQRAAWCGAWKVTPLSHGWRAPAPYLRSTAHHPPPRAPPAIAQPAGRFPSSLKSSKSATTKSRPRTCWCAASAPACTCVPKKVTPQNGMTRGSARSALAPVARCRLRMLCWSGAERMAVHYCSTTTA